jgi:diguanylate cyclase (GGDEF)-like protein
LALRNRIALTFLLLLAAVLGAALFAVSAANRSNARREVQRQLDVGGSVFMRLLESNRRLLTQAAQAVAADYGFREAVAARDTDTLVSALANSGARIGAGMVVLTSLDGRVIAAVGSHAAPGSQFDSSVRHDASTERATRVMVEDGSIYQMVSVEVRSPVPVARISMGFRLDEKAARELADITGLGVRLSRPMGDHWIDVVNTVPSRESRGDEVAERRIVISTTPGNEVEATLSRSLADARAPFERLTNRLFLIAGVSLIGFGWAAFWIARNITRPLRELTASVDQIRAGSYDVALTLNRHDELGVLAEGLELMQGAVRSRDQSIRRLAYEDTLTGLMNRTAFNAALGEELSRAQGGTVAVAVINLLRFRRINEHLGYSVGDEILTTIARRLASLPSMNSAVARLAADEFAAFTRLTDASDLNSWGISLLAALSDPVLVENQPIDISATVGLALKENADSRADDLLRFADLAVERARRHKHALALYKNSLGPAAREQLSLLGELRHAVEHDELRLFFQPKMELSTGRVAGAEVLIRWQHPTRGLLVPADFIPFAEQTGFIRQLTRWTLEHSIARGTEWHRAGRTVPLAVNISADDIDVRLDARLASLLTKYALPPSLLTLELTESSFIDDADRALRILTAVAALGVSLSIDDFGTGYSSLSLLGRMPVHEMKIDRSFLQSMESDADAGSMVRSAIDMGHSLGLKVVAEGIETAAAAAQLRQFGCDIGQGYWFGKPMPADAFEAWLQGRQCVPVIAVPVHFEVRDVADTATLATY